MFIGGRNKGFRIISLVLKEHKIFKDLSIEFSDVEDQFDKQPYISLLIGSNGTGKSNLLRAISDIFRELYSIKTTDKRSNSITGFFLIKYECDGHFYSFGNYNDDKKSPNFKSLTSKKPYPFPKIQKDGYSLDIKDAPMPNALLVSSLMITDKFFNDVKGVLPYYKYLGVRTSSNQAGTKTYIRKTVDMLIDALETSNEILTRFKLGELLKNIGFKDRLLIQYKPIYQKHFFNIDKPLTENRFRGFFEEYEKYTNRKTPPWGFKRYEKIKSDTKLIRKIVDACNDWTKNDILTSPPNSKSRILSFEIISGSAITEYSDLLKELSLLDIIRAPEIVFFKNGNPLNYKESSSGEQNIVTTLIGVMAQIKPNTLVLLDEPEVSLHPNWQMRYINDFIVKTFEDYSDCHFVISTHSHFLVSDVRPNGSKVVGLMNDKSGVKVTYPIPENTFGWSAEQILLEVFQTPTTRNYYVADKIGEILELISKNELRDNTPEIRKRVQELIELNIDELPKEDPLKEVIDKLIQKYG
ncbi:AAA family ATPase [uncultured Psychroserpens sp.]|uniref:AAA family ATPase n=1 Tax=uncultured Psychroserpens sp. TaxID=255436 RepID=UPI002608B750|nr:AAA family ATPase [uncultured Psychroserpens sp.]